MRGPNYTSAEDDAIRDMVNRGLPHKTIARHLNRPLASIQKRIQHLGLHCRVRWTKELDDKIRAEAAANLRYGRTRPGRLMQLADELGLTHVQVWVRAQVIGAVSQWATLANQQHRGGEHE